MIGLQELRQNIGDDASNMLVDLTGGLHGYSYWRYHKAMSYYDTNVEEGVGIISKYPVVR